jgi:hypothetical protein
MQVSSIIGIDVDRGITLSIRICRTGEASVWKAGEESGESAC